MLLMSLGIVVVLFRLVVVTRDGSLSSLTSKMRTWLNDGLVSVVPMEASDAVARLAHEKFVILEREHDGANLLCAEGSPLWFLHQLCGELADVHHVTRTEEVDDVGGEEAIVPRVHGDKMEQLLCPLPSYRKYASVKPG
jgi:hypothetical protein